MADIEFTRGPARRPATVVEDPILQWASGLQTVDKRIYAGWLLEVNKHEALDLSMHEAGFEQVTIKHGNGNIVTHWAVETATAFVVADGVQTPAEMRRTAERHGIAYGWRTLDDGRRQSQLKMRVLLRELLMVNCYEVLTITVKSTMTDDLLNALMLQYDVLNAVDGFRQDDGKPPMGAPFYACSLPLTYGEEVTRGKTATKSIIPPAAAMPSPITREYIKANWIKRDWTAFVESIVDDTVRWSVEESQRISGGVEQALEEVA
jgi:hypothetical protein